MSPINEIFATDSHLPALDRTGKFQVTAAYNRTKAKAEVFATKAQLSKSQVYDSLDQLLQDPNVDAIDALLPVQFNLETIKKAIAAGKPIAIEKPISSNLADGREIVKLANSTNLPILILENWLYHNTITEMKKLLPKIGRPVTFMYRSTGPYTPSKYHTTSWRSKPQHIGGYLSDGGVHQMALLTEVLGEVESVAARTDSIRPQVSGDVDTLNALLNMKSGIFGTFVYGSFFGATKKTSIFTILGTNGTIQLDFYGTRTITFLEGPDGANIKTPEVIMLQQPFADGICDEFENFSDAIAKNDKLVLKCSPEKAFHHLAVIVAAVESGQNRGVLTRVAKP